MGKVILFLSPHLDDAALSCPGYMQRLAREGHDVRIVSVFTDAGPERSAEYRVRRSEDRTAAREIGVSATHLGLLDAPFRSPKYGDFCGIVFGRAREYPATRRLVVEQVARAIARYTPVKVVAPLAVGNHVDHRLVRDAALLAVRAEVLLFYEDRPYAFVREQVHHVLGRNMALRPPRFWNRYFAATYIRNYRGSATSSRIMESWKTVPPFPLQYRLHRESTVKTGPSELRKTLTALNAYRSQMPDLFESDAERRSLYAKVPEIIYRVSH